jgi:hypothetical protein
MLRRRSDPRAATVTASKRGERTLIIDIPRDATGRAYQSRSEVLAPQADVEHAIAEQRRAQSVELEPLAELVEDPG